jgi:hypothetical protein
VCPYFCACRERNERLDQRREELARQATTVAREQEDRLASMPVGVDTFRANTELRRAEASSRQQTEEAAEGAEVSPAAELESATAYLYNSTLGDAAPVDEFAGDDAEEQSVEQSVEQPTAEAGESALRPQRGSSARRAAASDDGAGAADDEMGSQASLRYNKARLAVTLEELERLRALLAEKTSELAAAESSVKELQQKTGVVSRSERSLQNALEKERAERAEDKKRSDALERELSLLRKQGAESARREKSAGADGRSKDVRLNRALEELERTKGALKQLREERAGAGQGARAEASRHAAENMKLRKRQSELILAFKKQAKLIDILKRQKLHVEAATLLSFTEEEFSKTLELGESLALA